MYLFVLLFLRPLSNVTRWFVGYTEKLYTLRDENNWFWIYVQKKKKISSPNLIPFRLTFVFRARRENPLVFLWPNFYVHNNFTVENCVPVKLWKIKMLILNLHRKTYEPRKRFPTQSFFGYAFTKIFRNIMQSNFKLVKNGK